MLLGDLQCICLSEGILVYQGLELWVCIQISSFSELFVKKTNLSPLCIDTFVKNESTMSVGFYMALCPIGLSVYCIGLCVCSLTVRFCLGYDSFLMWFEIGNCDTSRFALVLSLAI